VKTYLISKKTLNPTTNGKMNYCPYCLKDFDQKNQNKNISYKETMDPLTYFKFMNINQNAKGETFKEIEEYWECNRCKKHLTPKDFLIAYCIRPDGTKYSEPKRSATDERTDAI
jgi:uncharacterized CHY-type Zn-finger protein